VGTQRKLRESEESTTSSVLECHVRQLRRVFWETEEENDTKGDNINEDDEFGEEKKPKMEEQRIIERDEDEDEDDEGGSDDEDSENPNGEYLNENDHDDESYGDHAL
jgi:hypothetical protein